MNVKPMLESQHRASLAMLLAAIEKSPDALWGAKSLTADLAGMGNVVTVDLHGVSAQARSLAHDSVPDEAAGTNRATIDATMN